MNPFWQCFVPLLVAVDVLGNLPIYISLTKEMKLRRRRIVTIESLFTATAVSIGFLFIGKQVFAMLGIQMADFMIAGGILLFLLSVKDIVSSRKEDTITHERIGAVPLGVPLMAGPAVLTAVLLLGNEHGYMPTFAALVTVMFITGIVFWFSHRLMKVLGENGTQVLSKLANLLMAAIGVMIVRKGFMLLIEMSKV